LGTDKDVEDVAEEEPTLVAVGQSLGLPSKDDAAAVGAGATTFHACVQKNRFNKQTKKFFLSLQVSLDLS